MTDERRLSTRFARAFTHVAPRASGIAHPLVGDSLKTWCGKRARGRFLIDPTVKTRICDRCARRIIKSLTPTRGVNGSQTRYDAQDAVSTSKPIQGHDDGN